jgi:hypothetical protein
MSERNKSLRERAPGLLRRLVNCHTPCKREAVSKCGPHCSKHPQYMKQSVGRYFSPPWPRREATTPPLSSFPWVLLSAYWSEAQFYTSGSGPAKTFDAHGNASPNEARSTLLGETGSISSLGPSIFCKTLCFGVDSFVVSWYLFSCRRFKSSWIDVSSTLKTA